MTHDNLAKTTVIRGAHLVCPIQGLDKVADIALQAGRIAAIGDVAQFESGAETFDATGLTLFPALVDMHAHIHGGGELTGASIQHFVHSAAMGGIGLSVIAPDHKPILDARAVIEHVIAQSERACLPVAALTSGLEGEALTDVTKLVASGSVAFSQGYAAMPNLSVLHNALAFVASCDALVIVTPQEANLAGSGCVHEGAVSAQLGLQGIPVASETIAISQYLHLQQETGVRLHFSKLTSAAGVELIREAKARGAKVSADVALTHLFLTEMDVDGFNVLAKTNPVLRSQTDKAALLLGLQEGVIDTVCSNHREVSVLDKKVPFEFAVADAPTHECYLPLLLRLADECGLSEAEMLRRHTQVPLQILGLEAGGLAVGAEARVALYDRDTRRTVEGVNPFVGWELHGKVVMPGD